MSLADLLIMRPEFRVRTEGMSKIEGAVRAIEQAFPDVGRTEPVDVDRTIQRVSSALRTESWNNISYGDVCILLRTALLGERHLPNDLRLFIDKEAQATTHPQLLDVVASAYMETWAAKTPKTQYLREILLTRRNLLPVRFRSMFDLCPEFLDAEDGSRLIGRRMVEVDDPFKWLRSVGLSTPHGDGFMRFAHTAFLSQSDDPEDSAALNKLLTWVAPKGGTILDDGRAAEVVDRILSPWTTRVCPEQYRDQCLGKLIDQFGDPRRENPSFWSLVGAGNVRVIKKWLAKKSMEAMFKVVTEAEKSNADGGQWAYREQFWMSLYKQGKIDEAWIALGRKAIPIAERFYQRTSDESYRSFGHFSSRSDTCLLFMRIGSKTFIEGSHNFRVHIFPNPSRQTPQLYEASYDLDEILLPNPHSDARRHSGDWTNWVRQRIGRE